MLFLLFLGGIFAGTQNALAGGGSFVTLGMLVFAGLDPRAANITSTIALFPGMVTTGFAGSRMAVGAEGLSIKALVVISLIGGLIGALLLLATPPTFFASLVPWLVLFATAVFFWCPKCLSTMRARWANATVSTQSHWSTSWASTPARPV